jgi:hypothetical protein
VRRAARRRRRHRARRPGTAPRTLRASRVSARRRAAPASSLPASRATTGGARPPGRRQDAGQDASGDAQKARVTRPDPPARDNARTQQVRPSQSHLPRHTCRASEVSSIEWHSPAQCHHLRLQPL